MLSIYIKVTCMQNSKAISYLLAVQLPKKKTGKGDDVTFCKHIFGHLYLSYITINDIFEILRKSGQDRHVFARKKLIWKFELI